MDRFPNLVQAALLFDRPDPAGLDAVLTLFADELPTFAPNFAVTRPSANVRRLIGQTTTMTLEAIDAPVQAAVLRTALDTPFRRLTNPNADALLAQHRSHVLVNVQAGALPAVPQVAGMLRTMGLSQMLGGQTAASFLDRVLACMLLAQRVHRVGRATLVHWGLCDHLLAGPVFASLMVQPIPSLLHILPLLFRVQTPGAPDAIGLTTFGAGRFVDREIHVVANPLPWTQSVEAMLAFLRIATARQGYVVPSGAAFSDDDAKLVCRVTHVPPGQQSDAFDGPLYRIAILRSATHGVIADAPASERIFTTKTTPDGTPA